MMKVTAETARRFRDNQPDRGPSHYIGRVVNAYANTANHDRNSERDDRWSRLWGMSGDRSRRSRGSRCLI